MVGEHGTARGGAGPPRVDGRNQREVVLEFVEVDRCRGEGAVERVLEGGVERAERELVDDVGEVECWEPKKRGRKQVLR